MRPVSASQCRAFSIAARSARPIMGEPEHAEHGVARGAHQRVVLGDQQILEHRHAREQPDVLERAGDPRAAGDEIVRHALEQEQRAVAARQAARVAKGQRIEIVPYGGVAMGERDPPFARLVEAGDAVEHGGLAGAVRPDQRGDVAAPDGERQAVDGDEAAEPHGEMLDPQERLAHPRPSLTRLAADRLALDEMHRGVARRDQPARPHHHDHHHGEAEHQHAVLGRIERVAEHLLEHVELAQRLRCRRS